MRSAPSSPSPSHSGRGAQGGACPPTTALRSDRAAARHEPALRDVGRRHTQGRPGALRAEGDHLPPDRLAAPRHAGRLKALTVIHNYRTQRADGTTAAERFFGKKPRDLFTWLLERLPDLPRPAAKRPNKATQTSAKAG